MSDQFAGASGPGPPTAQKAARTDLGVVAQTLALAFYDDPVARWMIGDGSRRRQLLPRFFGAIAASYLAHDEVLVMGEATAAIWAPPGAKDDEDLPGLLEEALGEYAPRLGQLTGLLAAKHPAEPLHHLLFLGTRPQWQGRGLGSSLMGPVLEICDRDGVPAYLEASSERNRQLYLRHGFDVTDELLLPDGPTLWCMRRSPR